jgi:hypothetical protein
MLVAPLNTVRKHSPLTSDTTTLDGVLGILAREGSQGVIGRAIKGII